MTTFEYATTSQNSAQTDIGTDRLWLTKAIALSRQCTPSHGAFSVGAIIIGENDDLISTGFSRETEPTIHAEEIAIARATASGKSLKNASIYTSLEPCSMRLSGKTPCMHHILAAGLNRVVFALSEPTTFVHCTAQEDLEAKGITVIHIESLGALVHEVNAHVINGK